MQHPDRESAEAAALIGQRLRDRDAQPAADRADPDVWGAETLGLLRLRGWRPTNSQPPPPWRRTNGPPADPETRRRAADAARAALTDRRGENPTGENRS